MTPSILQNLVAVTPGGEITEDHLSGYYLLYTIEEQAVPAQALMDAFTAHGLEVTRLPKFRRPEHVMMTACTSIERIESNGKRVEIRSEQVMRDHQYVVYQVTRHVHDRENRVVDHPKAMRVVFAFADNSLTFEPLGGADLEQVKSLADEIQEYYDTHQDVVPGRTLRKVIRQYVEAAGALYIRDGNYFLPTVTRLTQNDPRLPNHGEKITAREFLGAVEGALAQVYGHEPLFHSIPCVNSEGERDFLKRKFVEACADDAKGFRDRCIQAINDMGKRKVRTDKRSNMIEERKMLLDRVAQYRAVLGDELASLDQDLSLADQALSRFLTEADS